MGSKLTTFHPVVDVCGTEAWNYICNNSTELQYQLPIISDIDTCLQEQYCTGFGEFKDDVSGIINWRHSRQKHYLRVSREFCEYKCNADDDCVGFNAQWGGGAATNEIERHCWLYTETNPSAPCTNLTVELHTEGLTEYLYRAWLDYEPTFEIYGVKRSKIKENCTDIYILE